MTSFFQHIDIYIKETSKNIAKKKFPLEMTILHYLCYLDDTKTIEFLLEQLIQQSIFVPPSFDYFDNSPLDIVIKSRNSAILNSILRYYSHENICKLSFQSCSLSFTRCLPQLLEIKAPGIADLLNSRICKAPGKFPDFCEKPDQRYKIYSFDSPLPKEQDYYNMLIMKSSSQKQFANLLTKLHLPENSNLSLKSLLLTSKFDVKKRSKVNFKIVDLKGILDPKLKFLDKLIQYPPNHPIFASDVVYYAIQYKWQTFARAIFFRKAIIYLIFVAITTLNSIILFPERLRKKGEGNKGIYVKEGLILDSLTLIYNMYFLKVEIKKLIKSGFMRYWRSPWNYIDVIVVVMSTLTSTIDIAFEDTIFEKEALVRSLHSISIFLIYFRLLSYIRCFDNLSFMIRMIIQSTIDMRFFLFITGFILVPLSLASKYIYFFFKNNRIY